MNTLIDIQQLHKHYQLGTTDIHVLKDLHFSIKEGEYVAIVGPSGSGKSTLMNILGFLDTGSSGRYFFQDAHTENFSRDQLAEIRSKDIGFVFQSFHLLSQKTVFENVGLPLLYRSDISVAQRKELVASALRAARLEEKVWQHKTNQISGGQRQRVAIARALCGNPRVILADEPTGNLDSKTGAEVLETLQSLNRELGVTIIIITHDQYVADHTDRVITIVDGEIVSDEKNHECC